MNQKLTSQPWPDRYDDQALKVFQQAITDIRTVLEARGLFHKGLQCAEFHQDLASILIDLADVGVTDRKEFCRRALHAIVDLGPAH